MFLVALFILSVCIQQAQDSAPTRVPPAWIDAALKAKPHLLEIRVSGNRAERFNAAMYKPAWARGPQIESEMWVYGGSAWNRVAKAGQVAKRIEATLQPAELPEDFIADEVHLIVPVRLYRGAKSEVAGSGEELLNVSVKPTARLIREFSPTDEYRTLLALPPDWELRVFAYDPASVPPGSKVSVFYTKAKKRDEFSREHLTRPGK